MSVLALLRTRRWIGFTALVIGLIIGFGVLSHWQWTRAMAKQEQAAAIAREAAADPVDASTLLRQGYPEGTDWRAVTATGEYDASRQLLVRSRPLDGQNGMWVMTPLRVDGEVLWVNRGWMAATKSATEVVEPPAPPAGTVSITARVRPSVADGWTDPAELPAGQVTAVDVQRMSASVGLGQTLPGYAVLVTSVPSQPGLTPIPLPGTDDGRNLSYAIQWVIFALIAGGGWFYLLRREARDNDERTTPQPAPAG